MAETGSAGVRFPAISFLVCLSIYFALSNGYRNGDRGAGGTAFSPLHYEVSAVFGESALDGSAEWESGLTGAGGAGISLPRLSFLVWDSVLGAARGGKSWNGERWKRRAYGTAFSFWHILKRRVTPHTRTALSYTGRTVGFCTIGDKVL